MKLRGLRQVRQRSGLSIGQLAELTGLRRETIAHFEQGKEDPQPYAVHRLAAILETSVADLSGAMPGLGTNHLRKADKTERLLPAS
ncbi:MAG TPA: helix-turn-helix transcriptional regulator [Ktedonobacterales bacterium]|jgi:predicted transcriptional regulator|nr:helix-turn-helix transcriptional regulator [Ktedonobacterales bacterium]